LKKQFAIGAGGNVLELFKPVSTFVFDIDGVLTDGTVLLLQDGLQARQMNVKDGLALQMAITKGYTVIIISGGSSEPVINRFKYLGVENVFLGVKNKVEFLTHYLNNENKSWQGLLYMGDDLPDIPVLQKAAIACCPADAALEVKEISHYISPYNGGYGCVRDVIEKVLKLNDHWHFTTEVSSK
jgi:3-deoxy-D-manno-octulosonate 8-phosphate phosphatase (KDO 8-P phosphatase)